MDKILRTAAYAGIISLILIPPEIILEHLHAEQPGNLWIFFPIVLIYMLAIGTSIFFYYGFYMIGQKLNIRAIMISSLIIILLNFFWYMFQFFTIRFSPETYNIIGGTVLVIFGISRIIFGIGIYKVRYSLGRLSTSISILEIVIGLFLISVLWYLVGFVLSLAAAVLQIMLLFRLSKEPSIF